MLFNGRLEIIPVITNIIIILKLLKNELKKFVLIIYIDRGKIIMRYNKNFIIFENIFIISPVPNN